MIRCCALLCLFCTLCKCGQSLDCSDSSKTKSTTMLLKSKLLCGYDKYVRPVAHHSNRTNVDTMLAPRVISFDDEQNTFILKSWLSMSWEDVHLTWDRLQYDNIDLIHLDSSMVWVPDLSIYNAQQEMTLDQEAAPVIVHFRGQVFTFMAPEIAGHCMANWDNWPYDVHSCLIQLGSRSYLGSTLNFKDPGLIMRFLLPDNEWEIVKTNSSRNETYLGPKNETDSAFLVNLNFQFVLRRHASVYVASYVIPGVVMMILSLSLLWLPSHKVERTAILCTLVFMQSLFLQYLAYKIPSNGNNTPFIVCFYRDCLALTGLLIVETLVTRSMYYWQSNPAYLTKVFQVIVGNKTLQFLFLRDLDPKSAAKLAEGGCGNDEEAVLVTSDEQVQQWKLFVNIVHRALFLLLLPTYILLSINLMPLNFSVSFY